MDIKKQIEALCAGTVTICSTAELEQKLKTKTRLTIKLGVDPTSSDLHLGHAVVLSKLRQFQDFGHHVVFIIGTFTARIGDPTGKSKTRPPLTDEQISAHTQTYFDQVQKILDPHKLTIRYNAEWLDALTSKQFIELCSKVTVARIIERDDFAKRMDEKQPIGLHEILYPLLQGYDSVVLKADVEIGGTDQTFNLLMGRHLQEQFGQPPQVVITLPLLEGLDGVQKMSKSLNNYIGLYEKAEQAFGKLMSLSDELMWRYYQVLLHMPPHEIAQLQKAVASGIKHPMELKKQLAHAVIARFWSTQEADTARAEFETLFQKRDFSAAHHITLDLPDPLRILDLVRALDPALSSTQARRLISDGAVTINDDKCTDPLAIIDKKTIKTELLVRIGKHKFFRVTFR